jgi:general secretion pathway protein L
VGAQLGGPQAVTVLGLPLSRLSVRNLTLPFKDARSIAQTLPFELEEQLLVPVDSQVSDFILAGSTPDGGSRVIAFSAEQDLLAGLLGGPEGRPDPGVITPAALALAAAVARDNPPGRLQLLVHLELPAATLVLVDGPVPVLCRRLPWVEPPLQPRAEGDGAEADAPVVNPEALRLLAVAVERTIDLYAQESGAPMQPEGVVLTGPLADHDRDSGLLSVFPGLPVQVADLAITTGATCAVSVEDFGRGPYDAALALALTGLEKRPGINLRRGPFARPRSLFASRKRLVAAGAAAALLTVGSIGLLWNDYRRLEGRDRALRAEMTEIYRQTFPAVTTVREPYAEMQAAMRTVQGPAAPATSASAGQRVLGLLADISARIPASVALQVSRLAIDRETVLVKGSTDTFNAVQSIRNGLSASALFSEVKIVSATADKEKGEQGGQIRFELQLQLKGG